MNLFNFKNVSWNGISEGQNLTIEIQQEDDNSRMQRSLRVSFEWMCVIGNGIFRTQSEFGTIKQYGLSFSD